MDHNTQIDSQQRALNHYLDSLLLEEMPTPTVVAVPIANGEDVTEEAREVPEQAEEKPEASPEAEVLPATINFEAESSVEIEAESPIEEPQSSMALPAEQSQPGFQQPKTETPCNERMIPEWAQGPFQAIKFRIGDVYFMAPLAQLNGVLAKQPHLTPLPASPDSCLGMIEYQGTKVRVIDLNQLLGENSLRSTAELTGTPEHILLIGDKRYGIACDEVSSMMTIWNDQVRWPHQKGRNAWYAGIVRKHMCALLDADEVYRLLSRDESTQ